MLIDDGRGKHNREQAGLWELAKQFRFVALHKEKGGECVRKAVGGRTPISKKITVTRGLVRFNFDKQTCNNKEG